MPNKFLSNLELMNSTDYLIANSPSIYYNFIFWYFEQMDTHLYQGYIRSALYVISQAIQLEWSSYFKLFNWKNLREDVYPAMVQNPFIVMMIAVYFIILGSYLLKKILKISFFDEKFVPEMYNILAFYLFIVIPFKTSYFFFLINQRLHSTSLLPSFLKSTNMFYFLVVVPASYLCLCVISRLKRRPGKLGTLTNRICDIFRTIKSALIFSFILCYSLGIVLAVRDDLTIGLAVLISIAVQRSKIADDGRSFGQKILLFCSNLHYSIKNFFFLFWKYIVGRLFYYILVFILLHFLLSMLGIPINAIGWFEGILANFFSHQMTALSVSGKIAMFVKFITLCSQK